MLAAGHVGERSLGRRQTGAIFDGGDKIALERKFSIPPGEPVVKRMQVPKRFIDPIPLMRRGRESQAIGQKHGMIGNPLGRGEVFVDQRRRHRKRFGGVRKAFSGGAVGGKLARRPQIDAGQVADRGVVFGIAQPPQHARPGIAGPRVGLDIEKAAGPTGQPFPLAGRRMRLFLGRHLITFEHLDHRLPRLEVAASRGERSEPLQIEIPLLELRRMAAQAVLRQKRPYLGRKRHIVGQRIPGGQRAAKSQQDGEPAANMHDPPRTG